MRTALILACIALGACATPEVERTATFSQAQYDTKLIDSKETTLYRNGVAVRRENRNATATLVHSGQPPASFPFNTTSPATAQIISQTNTRLSRPGVIPPQPASPNALPPAKNSGDLTKEQKALILNAGSAAAITAYGIAFWDYFQTSPKANSEGWFGRTTKHGGADKLGHFWGTYTGGHMFSYVYRQWGFDTEQANALGALSSLGLQTLMELGDAFSGGFGFSYEDALMNVAGASAAYVLGKFPSLARKIDFRLEYIPKRFSDLTDDILTNYENQRYLMALKLDGFDSLHDSYLSYLELQVGYFTRGYEEFDSGSTDNRKRNLYFGVGLNVSKLVRKFADISVFDYIQVPYTAIRIDKGLD